MRKFINRRKIVLLLVTVLTLMVSTFGMSVNVSAETNEEESSDFQSKKGIQGVEFMYCEDDWQSLGVEHVLLNIDITQCFNPDKNGYGWEYNGNTYYFSSYVNNHVSVIRELEKAGVDVTVVLLMSYDSRLSNLTYTGCEGGNRTYYAWNLYDAEARNQIQGLLTFLFLEAYPDVDNWIIGNEVNMPNHYNYTGTLDLNTNASIYADEIIFTYNLLQNLGNDAKVYMSLDHSWAHNDDGRGLAGKDFLPAVVNSLEAKQKGVEWNVAYHAYAPIMSSANMWNSGYLNHSINTPFICGSNLEVLTDFIKNNYGSSHRVLLSEQGFNASSGEAQQAAALAYTYYAAEFNDMVDGVIFRSYLDDRGDGSFKFGLKNAYSQDLLSGAVSLFDVQNRQAYDAFKYMDTSMWANYTTQYLSVIGKSSWNEVIPNFEPAKFSNLNGFAQSADGVWRYYKNGVVDTTYTGMACNEYGWWYVKNGVVDMTYTGMAYNEYGWWYFRNGQLDWNYTGMACNEYGWWYFRNGQLDWGYTGMACNEYGWWYFSNGQLDWNYTGMACNEYGWWYFSKGQLDWGYTGMACNEYGWWYFRNGQLDWSYTGMACNEYGWWYYQNGQLDWNYTGMACNEYGWWYFNNGTIAFWYTGAVTIDGITYNVVNGQVVF